MSCSSPVALPNPIGDPLYVRRHEFVPHGHNRRIQHARGNRPATPATPP